MTNKTLIFCALASILTGCGGGGGESSGGQTAATIAPAPPPAPTETTLVETAELVVDEEFSFRTDMDLTLILSEVPQGSGVVNVYYDYEFHDVVNDIYYPDYQTRILSFYPQTSTSVEIQVSRNWQHLVVEFAPTTADGLEMYKKLDLSMDPELAFRFDG